MKGALIGWLIHTPVHWAWKSMLEPLSRKGSILGTEWRDNWLF